MSNKQKKQGFTLMEIIAVIGVSTVGLLGVSSLVVQNIQAQNVNRHYPVAAMLAQEGVELVRNRRDNNWLAGGDWLENVTLDGEYSVDYLFSYDDAPADISGDGTRVFYNDTTGFYGHSSAGASDTVYRRLVAVAEDPGGNMVDVTVTVQWADRGHDFAYVLRDQLYDWR